MALKNDLDGLWQLAGELAAARKVQAKAQTAALERQKAARDQANSDNWFGPTAQGAIMGGLTGFIGSGFNPIGAVAGAVGGGALGAIGHKQFNENPEVLPALGNAAITGAGMYNARRPLGLAAKTSGRSLSLQPGMQSGMDFGSDAGQGYSSSGIGLGDPHISPNLSLNDPSGYLSLENAAQGFNDIMADQTPEPAWTSTPKEYMDRRMNTLDFGDDPSGSLGQANFQNGMEEFNLGKAPTSLGRRGGATGRIVTKKGR